VKLSVVIPTYNRVEALRVVIPALIRSDVRPDDFEIVVADSHSTDGTAGYLGEIAAVHPHVRYVPGPYSGRAAARNAGIDAARGEIVLFTDADIIAAPDLLSRHVARHEAERSVAIVGMELQVATLAEYAALRDRPSLRRPLHPPGRTRLSWLYFLTGNASVRRADLLHVGKFDENFTGYGHEDLELGFRLQAAGIRIRYDAAAVNYHWHPVPYAEQKEKMALAGASTVRFWRKHPRLDVRARLGMTPVSLAVHGLLAKMPALLDLLERAGEKRTGLAREIVYQYRYVSGIKDALAHR